MDRIKIFGYPTHPHRLFLVDGFGALLTATLLLGIPAWFGEVFGMLSTTVRILGLVACAFATYSFICYRTNPTNWPPFLAGIAVANILYVLATAALMAFHGSTLTTFGRIYFIVEMIIIVVLVALERSALTSKHVQGTQNA